MDPGWVECEYCKSDAAAKGTGQIRRETIMESNLTPIGSGLRNAPRLPTDLEGTGLRPRPPRKFDDPDLAGGLRPSRLDSPPPFSPPPVAPPPFSPPPAAAPFAGPPPVSPQGPVQPPADKRGATIFRPNPTPTPAANPQLPPPQAPLPSLARRKIVGVLVSYSWYPDGKVFPVYEERNLIGRGSHCQIHVPEDTSMSDENSHIYMITQKQKCVVGDKGSLNGTYLNGERILETFHPLPNYANIRAGSTDFTFIMVQPPADPGSTSREGS
jgi:hypothetical protein